MYCELGHRRSIRSGMLKNSGNLRSEFILGLLEKSDKDPLTYVVHGIKTVHHLHEHAETTDKIVSQFRIRLAVERRSEENPAGLLIADYVEEQIDGEKRGQTTGQS